jgi:hypothetical protein
MCRAARAEEHGTTRLLRRQIRESLEDEKVSA